MVNNMNHIIDTPCGKIKGVKSNIKGIIAFKGIRYATAERFQLPKEVMMQLIMGIALFNLEHSIMKKRI